MLGQVSRAKPCVDIDSHVLFYRPFGLSASKDLSETQRTVHLCMALLHVDYSTYCTPV